MVLQRRLAKRPRRLLRWHFRLMWAVVLLTSAHVALNA
jgi:hypothetical protein